MDCAAALLLAKRSWFVPDVRVWGSEGLGKLDLVLVEKVLGISSIFHQQSVLEGAGQVLRYDALADHRGNTLPSALQSPRVFVRARDVDTRVAVTQETAESFSVVRTSDAAESVEVDLYIVELGD